MSIFLYLFAFFSCIADPPAERKSFEFAHADSFFSLSFLFWPEYLAAKNLALLNSSNYDEIVYARHFLDIAALYSYGKETFSYDIIQAKCVVRSRALWGLVAGVLETTERPSKELKTIFGAHRHALYSADFWIRELWLALSLSDLIGIPFGNKHTLTWGAFPFELGRGISLGLNYPSLPFFVGFFIDYAIDQYPFGASLSGDICKDRLSYDLYGTILANGSATFDQTDERIRTHQYGHRADSARGFGSINYLVASRLQWYAVPTTDEKKVYFEPYALYNWNPELTVEFLDDAVSSLSTFGLMAEFTFGPVEWGFECACNRGEQKVFGVDRTATSLENREGVVVVVNEKVIDTTTGLDALVIPEHQAIIQTSAQAQSANGRYISPTLRNAHRFRDPYILKYRGSFFVLDASYVIKKDVLKLSAALGIATGDHNPRVEIELEPDRRIRDFTGFISINDSYGGKRVTSSLFLVSRIDAPRVTDFGFEGLDVSVPFMNAARFTNIIYAGVSADYQYKATIGHWHINPNLLWYWQEVPSRRFESKKQPTKPSVHIPKEMDTFLGTELNVLAELEFYKSCTFFLVGALFLPGSHYKQMKGIPLTDDQIRFVKQKEGPCEPLLGSDTACLINFGLNIAF